MYSSARTILMLLVGTATVPAWSQTSSHPWAANISLTVTGSEPTKSRIVSFMSRELRSIPGVTLTDTNLDWTISVVAVEPSDVVVLSVLVTTPQKPLVDYLKTKVTDDLGKEYLLELEDAVELANHEVRSAAPRNLDELCKNIVADFDATTLEGNRKIWQRLHPK